MKSDSNLEKVLAAGHFAVTGELGPPRGANLQAIKDKAAHLKGMVDAVNVTDNQTAVVRMASWAVSLVLREMGMEPNYQMVCRDRNRLAMQSDILGAAALGINTMLCLSGDHPSFGDHPQAANVHDIDSIQQLQMVTTMRDQGRFMGGAEIDTPPRMFVGAAANPFGDPFELRVLRLGKKVAAGADFIQTQCIYNMERFAEYMRQAVDMGLTEKTKLLAGVTPLKSAGMARYMAKKVPGMDVPDEVVKRIADQPKEKQAEEGIKLLCEQIEQLREMPGVAGIHLMAIEWEHRVPEIVERAGLLPRPQV
ncbi:MAG: methylenetetrahydrofolate reductase [Desulfarculaceae bacterium]|nr:methylenetetrahydrofolate reductase [Desulfarculaceae bacterium]MCF8046482.1 methylenetetrahydrofolate reductase [Desulfarculaceae bacterium]MCF8065363.1 methylenetetrahydrofolate reductase [Desulfarculaceae bacterium]MCF8096477.1 methylenetetrahydrofolate reductase [Desulfarculaceae bacterium]MCF8121033.1 methylenetetrahydrofolate reductase [Desulfarculaceae bacterium]